MKKLYSLLFILFAVLLASCQDSFTEKVTYQVNEPIFMSSSDFKASVKVTRQVREIKNQGKICFYQGFLFISEPDEGIHIIDNRNPASPENVGFIELLGNADLAIRNDLLYADSYVDLVWFDVSNPLSPEFVGRLDSIFTEALPPIENEFGIDYNMCYGSKRKAGVIVGWKLKERTEEIEYYTGGWFGNWGNKYNDMTTGSFESGGASNGKNGSMSRFALYDNKLYSVIRNNMSIFDLSGDKPYKAAENIYIGQDVETLFSYKDNMFMGTPTGMLIYSVTDPLNPEFMSSVTHIFGCDPVVVYNDLAYVTVHSGNNCGQKDNELFLVDVSDVRNPKRLITLNMTKPKGLGIDNDMLFLCDDGLKIFSIKSPEETYLKSIKHIKGMEGYDLIAYNNVLMMIAKDGLYQYDYSDVNDIKPLSVIKFAK